MVEVIKLSEKETWNNIVESFKDYDIYYLNGYLQTLKTNGDGEPLLFYYHSDDIKAINVVLKRDISDDKNFKELEKNKYYDFTTPYGYGGWLVEGNGDKRKLFNEYEQWCANNNIVCEFVRFHPLISNQEYSDGYYNVIPLGKVIAMNTANEDLLWENMSDRYKYRVRKAVTNGITINVGGKEKLSTFIDIYNETMDRNNADQYYFFKQEYYECMFDELKDNTVIFSADLNGETISNCIVFVTNNRGVYHLSGSRRQKNNLNETNLMLYEAAKWLCKKGNIDTFLLGGGVGSKEDGLYNFKKGFNDKNNYQFYIGNKIFMKNVYDDLVSRRSNIENHNYFPEYRG